MAVTKICRRPGRVGSCGGKRISARSDRDDARLLTQPIATLPASSGSPVSTNGLNTAEPGSRGDLLASHRRDHHEHGRPLDSSTLGWSLEPSPANPPTLKMSNVICTDLAESLAAQGTPRLTTLPKRAGKIGGRWDGSREAGIRTPPTPLHTVVINPNFLPVRVVLGVGAGHQQIVARSGLAPAERMAATRRAADHTLGRSNARPTRRGPPTTRSRRSTCSS
jgi:hypothetical protein